MSVKHSRDTSCRSSLTRETWRGMLYRCSVTTGKEYAWYGARGITVCERWLVYENFIADMGERPPGTSIDRIDNDKGYEPGNCRWATKETQRRNQRRSWLVTYRGRTQTLAEWAEELGFTLQVLQDRLDPKRCGWDVERAFTTPVDRSRYRPKR